MDKKDQLRLARKLKEAYQQHNKKKKYYVDNKGLIVDIHV